jgi:hypothetical protein
MLVLLMAEQYEVRRWNGLRWHDARWKFNDNRFWPLSNITVKRNKNKNCNDGITDWRNL